MTREEARQWIPLLQAYADGAEIINVSDKSIFSRTEFDELGLASEHGNFCEGYGDYRIKPQDHSKCVMNFHEHPFSGIAVICIKQDGKCTLPDDCFCKDFREKSK